jgi:MHS family proline/betaine transporter-like MFS transporter
MRKKILAMIFISGFSYINFSIPMILMNSFLPLVSNLTKIQAIKMNTSLLIVDMILLPFFGYLSMRFSKEKMMKISVISSICLSSPLFFFLKGASIIVALFIRFIFVLIGVSFAASFHSWMQEQIPPYLRYTTVSFAYSIGSQLIGAPTCAISLFLFKTTKLAVAPSFYIILIAIVCAFIIFKKQTYPQEVEG